jgi:hypothetical protein
VPFVAYHVLINDELHSTQAKMIRPLLETAWCRSSTLLETPRTRRANPFLARIPKSRFQATPFSACLPEHKRLLSSLTNSTSTSSLTSTSSPTSRTYHCLPTALDCTALNIRALAVLCLCLLQSSSSDYSKGYHDALHCTRFFVNKLLVDHGLCLDC